MSFFNALNKAHDAQRTRARKQERDIKRKAFDIVDIIDDYFDDMHIEHVSYASRELDSQY